MMALKCSNVHRNCVFDQVMCSQIFKDAADLGVALLHRHDLLDVLDIASELIDFLEKLNVLGDKEFSQLREISRQLLPVWVCREIFGEVAVLRCQKQRGFGELRCLRPPQFLHDQTRRDVDAIQNIADVMEYARRNLGHTSQARAFEQFLL